MKSIISDTAIFAFNYAIFVNKHDQYHQFLRISMNVGFETDYQQMASDFILEISRTNIYLNKPSVYLYFVCLQCKIEL